MQSSEAAVPNRAASILKRGKTVFDAQPSATQAKNTPERSRSPDATDRINKIRYGAKKVEIAPQIGRTETDAQQILRDLPSKINLEEYVMLHHGLNAEAKKQAYLEILREKGHVLPPEELKKMKKLYNKYKVQSMANGLFVEPAPDSDEDSEPRMCNHNHAIFEELEQEKKNYLYYDPVRMDENNYMEFQKRVTPEEIMSRIRKTLGVRIMQSMRNKFVKRKPTVVSQSNQTTKTQTENPVSTTPPMDLQIKELSKNDDLKAMIMEKLRTKSNSVLTGHHSRADEVGKVTVETGGDSTTGQRNESSRPVGKGNPESVHLVSTEASTILVGPKMVSFKPELNVRSRNLTAATQRTVNFGESQISRSHLFTSLNTESRNDAVTPATLQDVNKLFVNGGGSHALDFKSPIRSRRLSSGRIPNQLYRNPRQISDYLISISTRRTMDSGKR